MLNDELPGELTMIFKNRTDAGKKLGLSLLGYRGQDSVVYALPRGGVVVAAEVARMLGAPLDLIVVRKIGHPQSPEYAIAAVAENGLTVENESEVKRVDPHWFTAEVRVQQEEARRRSALYLRGRQRVAATGKVAIIVDDGLATGLTMFLAIKEVRRQNPRAVIVAVPVAPANTVARLQSGQPGAGAVDAVEVLYIPQTFAAIGAFYHDFNQVSDEEVIRLMGTADPAAKIPVK